MRSRATDALAGVDGCRGGWVVAWDGGAQVLSTFAHILSLRFDLILIDIPIGLLDTRPRRCDVEARSLIGARRSSVFPAPARRLLRSRRYARQCSVQLWNILDKIREVDAAMTPARQRRVREAHPEVSFALLNGGPLDHPKKRAEGEAERRALLRPLFGDLPSVPGAARDDVLDAHVLLWSARRVARGEACVLGSGERDERGLRCEIVG
jgi:predicted RNase H-like nuclease